MNKNCKYFDIKDQSPQKKFVANLNSYTQIHVPIFLQMLPVFFNHKEVTRPEKDPLFL